MSSQVPMLTPNDLALIKQFESRHERTYNPTIPGGPPDDGSDTAAILAILWALEPMISNGGWPAVFYNHVGWSVPLASRVYRILNMPECAARCELALQLVCAVELAHPGRDYSSDDWLSDTLMQAISEADWDRLDNDWFTLTQATYANIVRWLRTRAAAHPTL